MPLYCYEPRVWHTKGQFSCSKALSGILTEFHHFRQALRNKVNNPLWNCQNFKMTDEHSLNLHRTRNRKPFTGFSINYAANFKVHNAWDSHVLLPCFGTPQYFGYGPNKPIFSFQDKCWTEFVRYDIDSLVGGYIKHQAFGETVIQMGSFRAT